MLFVFRLICGARFLFSISTKSGILFADVQIQIQGGDFMMHLEYLKNETPWGDKPFRPDLQGAVLQGARGRILGTILRVAELIFVFGLPLCRVG